MNILMFEDEQPSGEKLKQSILIVKPSAHIRWLRTISEGRNMLTKQNDFDLIFSDIELLDGNIFTLFQEIPPSCPIIFCTAYDNYLVEAFQTNGIAYLLKPYDNDAFQAAWKKFNDLFRPSIDPNLFNLLKNLLSTTTKSYKSHFIKKKNNETYLLGIDDIILFQANGDYTYAFDASQKRHLLDYSIGEIEAAIDPQQFFRINRSELIAFRSILKFEKYIKNRLAVTLKGIDQLLYTSNSRSSEFKAWINAH